jgi:cobalt-zinc-cadmium efflux system outer membrane protein
MKIPMLAAMLVFAANTFAQSQSMPGMQMPDDPKPQPTAQQSHTPKTKISPKHQDSSMQGMDMGHPGSAGNQSPMSTDMKNMSTDMPMSQAQHDGSVTHDTMNLQEPEDPSHKTGTNVPAPDLLNEVTARRAMSLQEFLGMADKSNPTIAQANDIVQRSAAQARQAGFYPNPTVGYQGEQIRGGSYAGGEQGAFIQQTVVLGGKLGLRRQIYNEQKQSDQLGVEEQTYRVHNDVAKAFYEALASQATVVVRQRLLGLALNAVETVHQLANVGQADAPDILQAEVEGEQAKVDFETAQRDYLKSFRRLAAFSGRQELEVSPLAGNLEAPPELDAEHQVANILHSSPTVKRMQQEIAVNEARLRVAKRDLIPDLLIKAGEEYNFEHITENPVKSAGPQSFATVGINLPLWNRNQGNVVAAQADEERAKQEVLRTQLSLKQQAEPLAQSYMSARFTADRYKTQLIPRAQRAYQLYLTKYQNMAMAYPQVLVSQRTLFQLQIGYLSALRDVWTNAIALENFTLGGGLDAPTSTGSSTSNINLPYASSGALE